MQDRPRPWWLLSVAAACVVLGLLVAHAPASSPSVTVRTRAAQARSVRSRAHTVSVPTSTKHATQPALTKAAVHVSTTTTTTAAPTTVPGVLVPATVIEVPATVASLAGLPGAHLPVTE